VAEHTTQLAQIMYNINNQSGDTTTKFISACEYCNTNSLTLYIPQDITINLLTDVKLPSILGKFLTITNTGAGNFVLQSNKNYEKIYFICQIASTSIISDGVIENIKIKDVNLSFIPLVNDGVTMTYYGLHLSVSKNIKIENVEFKNFINPLILIAPNSKEITIRNLKGFNVGQGVFIKGSNIDTITYAENITIDNVQTINTLAQKNNIINNYSKGGTGDISGYDTILLESCKQVLITNIIGIYTIERLVYVSDSFNVMLRGFKGISGGGLKFAAYDGIIAKWFKATDGVFYDLQDDAMLQLYNSDTVVLSNVTHTGQSSAEKAGWLLRSGQTIKNVYISDCNLDYISRSVWSHDGVFPQVGVEEVSNITFKNCKCTHIGLIKWIPYPLFDVSNTIIPTSFIFNNIEIKDCIFKATSASLFDVGAVNGYGFSQVFKANHISGLNWGNNTVKGFNNVNTDGTPSSYPSCYFHVGSHSDSIIIKQAITSNEVITVRPLFDANLYVSSGSEFIVSVTSISGIEKKIIKPLFANITDGSTVKIMLNNTQSSEFTCNGKIASLYYSLAVLTGLSNIVGMVEINNGSGIGKYIINGLNVTKHTSSDTGYVNSWLADGSTCLYLSSDTVLLRSSTAKNLVLNYSLKYNE